MMIIDWLSLIAIGFFSLRGLFQGMSKEFSSTFSWIIAIFASWYLGPFLLPFLEDFITNKLKFTYEINISPDLKQTSPLSSKAIPL